MPVADGGVTGVAGLQTCQGRLTDCRPEDAGVCRGEVVELDTGVVGVLDGSVGALVAICPAFPEAPPQPIKGKVRTADTTPIFTANAYMSPQTAKSNRTTQARS